MLRQLIVSILTTEIKKELTGMFEPNWPESSPQYANNSVGTIPTSATPMIDLAGPLFYSPKEQRLLDYLATHGPAKQSAIVKHFREHADSINDTTVKELLANLGHRRAVISGPDGYELRRKID